MKTFISVLLVLIMLGCRYDVEPNLATTNSDELTCYYSGVIIPFGISKLK